MKDREHFDINESICGDYIRTFCSGMPSEHNHTHYEISIVVSGKLDITNNEDHIAIDTPCVIFHFPGTYHRVATDPTVKYERYNINFTAEIFRHYPSILTDTERLFSSNVAVLNADQTLIDELLYYIRPFLSASCSIEKRTALLGVILNILKNNRTGGFISKQKPNGSYINGIVRYISDMLSPDMRAEDIASEFFVSRAKLAGDFKRETGMTLKEYIMLLCVERAKLSFAAGKSVHCTAMEIGFSNTGTFIRLFKRMTGVTPGTYCQSLKK